MKLGLGSYAFRWSIGIKDRIPEAPMTAFDILEAASDYGLDVVQYADNMPLHRLSEADHHRLYALAQEKGIELELGTQSFHADEIKQYLEIGKRLHARIMRVALDADDAKMPVPDLVEQMLPLLDIARHANIRIAIENHFNFPSPRMVEVLETVEDDTLGVCLDVANSICAGEWPEETVEMLAPHTINFHLKDYVIVPDAYGVGFTIRGVPLGQGRAPIDWILDQLSHCDPDMSVLLEHWLPYEMASREWDWLEQTVAEAKSVLERRSGACVR